MDFQRTSRQYKEINLTALIDIVFHLMVFVMLTTSFVVAESMELSLPSTKSSTAAPAPAPTASVLRIHITPDNLVQIDTQVMNMEQMSATLGARIAANADIKMTVLTTAGVSVQQLIAVLDAIYLAGGRNVQVDKAS